ncbi:hypothetical protein PACTADRAFT_50957 [Pachysolen tannophilus NRRL Y-2460]|uniref:Uncharacterized protein n=1 Tax=Pachysolen tannophilus NRRL Y-2460 TaxID=669874 RepID=A0A1E4TQP3_PACTA|nr:hypothetical protein PACTADRAFT_50957 [Pachysolen tannophilus NRRL Y-2460]
MGSSVSKQSTIRSLAKFPKKNSSANRLTRSSNIDQLSVPKKNYKNVEDKGNQDNLNYMRLDEFVKVESREEPASVDLNHESLNLLKNKKIMEENYKKELELLNLKKEELANEKQDNNLILSENLKSFIDAKSIKNLIDDLKFYNTTETFKKISSNFTNDNDKFLTKEKIIIKYQIKPIVLEKFNNIIKNDLISLPMLKVKLEERRNLSWSQDGHTNSQDNDYDNDDDDVTVTAKATNENKNNNDRHLRNNLNESLNHLINGQVDDETNAKTKESTRSRKTFKEVRKFI